MARATKHRSRGLAIRRFVAMTSNANAMEVRRAPRAQPFSR